ncbi:NADH:ubiquinone reductase (Na(+)-transporting) subunit C [Perlabentimonas gracilis]|jgi:Na+-transporting NADH:ubiquinone oxidoreductase subunit C|uniref:NADH:ubiquinone reductase (Na(+)-transporting) subunit C n=1 Tax=Perlabentimonas gracilis TaxID=2715279 RepID=UPI001409B30E|nr:NADH:ubiquinone reductase (Na(+)-transporting) subunit C [Perlabentimonas gracilis]NHB67246.1 NADH:ubiquinone reductase (Na(+)-transporting) subunit C [Perlabentimonas gracilis]
MKKQSNLYIFMYSSVMVIIVAALLSLASTALRPFQEKNVETEKRLDILRSVGRASDVASASNKHDYVGNEFNQVVVEQLVVNRKGNRVEGVDPFTVDLKVEFAKPEAEQNLPVYVAKLNDGSTKYILPLLGRGLWGPIWGYISLNDDFNTVYGASFAHKSETPGLGAEIANADFQQQFKGKQIFRDSKFVSISVVKGGASSSDPHSVDAVSGGTITSQGLEDMIKDCLMGYQEFFKKSKN